MKKDMLQLKSVHVVVQVQRMRADSTREPDLVCCGISSSILHLRVGIDYPFQPIRSERSEVSRSVPSGCSLRE